MSSPTKAQQIVNRMETLALNLLEKANADDAMIDVRLDVFEKVGKWVAVKNKLEDDGAGDINDFKRRIQGTPDQDKRYPPSRRPKGWTEPAPKQPRLDALKSRLSGGSPGGAVGDSNGAVGPTDPAV